MGTIDTHGYYSYYIKTRPNVLPFRVLIPDDFDPGDTEFIWKWIEYIFPHLEPEEWASELAQPLPSPVEVIETPQEPEEKQIAVVETEVIKIASPEVTPHKKPKGRPKKIHVEATPTLLTKLNREELIEHVQGELDRAHKIWSEQNGEAT